MNTETYHNEHRTLQNYSRDRAHADYQLISYELRWGNRFNPNVGLRDTSRPAENPCDAIGNKPQPKEKSAGRGREE